MQHLRVVMLQTPSLNVKMFSEPFFNLMLDICSTTGAIGGIREKSGIWEEHLVSEVEAILKGGEFTM